MKYLVIATFVLLWILKFVEIAYDPPPTRVQVLRNYEMESPQDIEDWQEDLSEWRDVEGY